MASSSESHELRAREIDGLRFAAVGFIALFHVVHYYVKIGGAGPVSASGPATRYVLADLAPYGHPAIALLVLCSGFIFAWPFAMHYLGGAPCPRWRPFVRRAIGAHRVLYVLGLTFFLGCFTIAEARSLLTLVPHYLAGVFYIHSLVFGQPNPIDAGTWFLEVEVQLILLAPLLARLFAIRSARARRGVLVALIVVLAAAQAWLVPPGSRLALTAIPFLPVFFAGFLLLDLHVAGGRPPETSPAWDVVALLALALMAGVWRTTQLNWLALPALTLLLGVATLRGRYLSRGLRSRRMMGVAAGWYGLYLLHGPLVVVAVELTRHLVVTDSFAVNLLVQCLLVAPLLAALLAAVLAGERVVGAWTLPSWWDRIGREGVGPGEAVHGPPRRSSLELLLGSPPAIRGESTAE
ncbi:MAG TPA: acyltransferase family protein [Gemmatimonadales bacterium]|nr:acyltransferase family protein [Gemmatimonadales bacterium]